jgi:hypothetical protein
VFDQVATVLCFFVLGGVTYQSVSNAVERRRFAIRDDSSMSAAHQLHLYCAGEAHPTSCSKRPQAACRCNWAWVQNDLKAVVRVLQLRSIGPRME